MWAAKQSSQMSTELQRERASGSLIWENESGMYTIFIYSSCIILHKTCGIFQFEFFLQLEKAGETYRKLKRPIEGSRCYEQLGKFNLAVETLVENDLYEMAIDTLKRYKSLTKVSDI